MLQIAGYQIHEQIHRSPRSSVYRGQRELDGAAVVLKVLNDELPSAEVVARFKREFEMGKLAAGQGAVPVLALEPVRGSWALVMEDVGARSLRSVLDERRLDLEEAVAIGARIAAALVELHALRIVHKDVNPANIVVVPSTGAVRLIDFGLATRLPRENPSLRTPNVLEGTLAYISPEQTGRMNRSIDYRSDLYSLGVVLYELLLGRLPFPSQDATELVHCHIAQRPPSPKELSSIIPRPVSDMVMKLLAKTAEERYQSAAGVASDLGTCLAVLSAAATGQVTLALEEFTPGLHDVPDRFEVPQKLYGRELEVERLLRTFERVARGRAELMLVSGPSGVGKSALVHEIHKPVLARRGYFIAGKFDQLHRDKPCASLIVAFGDLIRQLLTESEAHLAIWRQRLLEAVGDSGQALTEVMPEIELVIGPQPSVPALPLAQTQTRFHHVFQRFVRACAAEGHPLAIFLDDLQWADLPSLKLLESLLADPALKHLLIIGSYRDNEVGTAHPLRQSIEAVARAGAQVSTLELEPLGPSQVEQFVADALHCEVARAAPLARLISDRTAGNPFFMGQLLRRLHEDGLIEFDPSSGSWWWSMEAIRTKGVTEDVAQLMAARLQRLPSNTRRMLELAACIGNRFDLGTLALVSERPPREAARQLYRALEEGLILPRDEAWQLAEEGAAAEVVYTFLHDRVQQAAYALIAPEARPALHLRIGRLLREGTPPERLEERIFDIANHLNLGLGPEVAAEERREVARLNLLAGRRARASAALESSMHYFDAGLALLDDASWERDHDLTAAIHRGAMESAYLNGRIDRGEALSERLLHRARTAVEKVEVHEARGSSAMQRRDMARAETEGYTALEALGLSLPREMDLAGFIALLQSTKAAIGDRRQADLLQLPAMTDPRWLAASRVLLILLPGTYMRNPLLCLALQLEGIKICLEHGTSQEAAYFYSSFGIDHAVFLGQLGEAAEYGRLASELLERMAAWRLKSKVLVLNAGFVLHFTRHVREVLPALVEAVQAGMESGDLEYVGYAASHIAMDLMYAGEPLDAAGVECDGYLELLQRWGLENSGEVVRIVRQASRCLQVPASDPTVLAGDSFDEAAELPGIIATKNFSSVSLVHVMKAMLAVLFRAPGAAAVAEAGEAWIVTQVGQQSAVVHNFYLSLALLSACRAAAPDERARLLDKIEKNQQALRLWADGAPMNHEHRFRLVEAVRASVRGDDQAAMKLYEEAAEGALRNRYLQDEALAHELAGEHYQAAGRERLARAAFIDAANAYRRWGAEAKVADLARRYPEAIASSSARAGILLATSTSSSHSGTLDLAAVMKAAQAISGEIVLDRLLETLMRILVQYAGARRGLLVMERDGQLMVQAARSVEGTTEPGLPRPVAGSALCSGAIISYVARTGDSVVLADAASEGRFTADPYVAARATRSVLCAPLLNQGKVVAIAYLENDLASGAFTPERLEVIRLLSAQAALSLHNASLYAELAENNRTLEERVGARTGELQQKNDELARALKRLRDTQKQLVTQEKLASLGSLTAGIAHEIKNPLNFVNNFAHLSVGLAEELDGLLTASRAAPEETAELVATLRQNVSKIHEHGLRANRIIDGMLMHSRSASDERVSADLNSLVAESVNLAYHGMRGKVPDFQLTIDAEYDPAVGAVQMVVSDISRALINVINNACYAVQEKRRVRGLDFVPRLSVRTTDRGERVEVRVRDNGTGIAGPVLVKVFNPFFTTKPPGDGTGLGLSISHDIIVGRHQGEIRLNSVEGEYAEAVIELPKRAPEAAPAVNPPS